MYLVCYVSPEDVSDVCVSVFTVVVADVHSDEGEQRTLRVLTLGYLVLPEKFICLQVEHEQLRGADDLHCLQRVDDTGVNHPQSSTLISLLKIKMIQSFLNI